MRQDFGVTIAYWIEIVLKAPRKKLGSNTHSEYCHFILTSITMVLSDNGGKARLLWTQGLWNILSIVFSRKRRNSISKVTGRNASSFNVSNSPGLRIIRHAGQLLLLPIETSFAHYQKQEYITPMDIM